MDDRKEAAKTDAITLVLAARFYIQEYGEPPQGDRATLIKILKGNNPHKIVFIEFRPKSISKEGLPIDEWGSPYAFNFSNPAFPWAYSFGKNKVDDGGRADDINSWN